MNENLDRVFADLPRVLDVGTAAELLGTKKQTLYNWVKNGIVPAYKINGTWILIRDDVKDLIAKGSNQKGVDKQGDKENDGES